LTDQFIAIFASIPYNHYTNNSIQHYEGFYASKYMNEGKEIVLVGINFDEEKRSIEGFAWERVESSI
jgi:hypothetical protein